MAGKGKGGNTVSVVTKLAQELADLQELILWDVRFEKEGASWYLRIYIDKEDGTFDINHCETYTRAIDKILDQEDPIDQSYFLEVSSPGLERELRKNEHYTQYIEKEIVVKTIRPIDNVREFKGVLKSNADNEIVVEVDGEEITFEKNKIANTKVFYDFGN